MEIHSIQPRGYGKLNALFEPVGLWILKVRRYWQEVEPRLNGGAPLDEIRASYLSQSMNSGTSYRDMPPVIKMLLLGTSFNSVLDWPEATYVLQDQIRALLDTLDNKGGHVGRLELCRDFLPEWWDKIESGERGADADALMRIKGIEL